MLLPLSVLAVIKSQMLSAFSLAVRITFWQMAKLSADFVFSTGAMPSKNI